MVKDKFYHEVAKKLKEKGIEKTMFDIKLTTNILLQEYDVDDRKDLLEHEDELMKVVLEQYDFEEEFDREFGDKIKEVVREVLQLY